jgi:hypothetical protein
VKRRAWLVPLLWLLVPVLAAVLPWAWRRGHEPAPLPERVLPPLTLSGHPQRDRTAILERAALRLLPAGGSAASLAAVPVERAALMGEIGVELLPLDPAQGARVVQQAIDMATRPADRVTRDDLDAPERTRIGMLIRLARSLSSEPELRERALRTAYDEAQGMHEPISQVYALCLFAREAAAIDPARARSATQKAQAALVSIPLSASADPFAAAATAVARLDGRNAARPLVERALAAITSTPARPLVEARLAARLAEAAPDRARELAREALADLGGQAFGRSGVQAFRPSGPDSSSLERPNARRPDPLNSRQLHDVAVILAATHPEVAAAAVEKILDPAERVAALTEMGDAVEARFPARAEAWFRRALRQAEAVPDSPSRAAAVMAAARGLAAYDLEAAQRAVAALPGPLSNNDMRVLGARAVKRHPGKALRLIVQVSDGSPANAGRIEATDAVFLARVTAEPDLHRALAMAQQARNADLQAAALLAVAQRLKTRASS